MPNATPKGFFTTVDENGLPDLEVLLLDLAQQVETRLAQNWTQRGAVSISVSASAGASDVIVFPKAFAAAPNLQLTTRNSSFFATTGTPTTTQSGFSVRHVDNIATSAVVVVDWVATGVAAQP